MKRLAIISTHPIQYNAPWFEKLAQTAITAKVFYTLGPPSDNGKYDEGFGKVIQWDIPLLKGYDYTFVENVSPNAGTGHFKGVINPTLNGEVAAWRPDAILVFGWSFDSHLKVLRHFHGKVPILFRGDSTLLDELPGIKRLLRRLFLVWVYRHVDKVLYVGTNNQAYFKKHGLSAKQLVFSPHAIDNARFSDVHHHLKKEAALWRSALGYKPDDVVVVFAGKLEPKKNPMLLLEVARRSQYDRLKFLFIGNGELEQTLKTTAQDIPHIQFIDFQNQAKMPLAYRLADIFVLPSQGPGETWGLALNEAMASGVAVVASDKVGGAVDLIKPGVNGYIFRSGDVDELGRIFDMLMRDESYRAMGLRSQELIRDWSFEHIVQSIHTALKNTNQ